MQPGMMQPGQQVYYSAPQQTVMYQYQAQPTAVPERRVALYNTLAAKYLMAEHGSLGAHHDIHHAGHLFGPDKSHKGHFVLETHGHHQSIRTCYGQYISCTSGGSIYLSNNRHEYDTKWTVEWHPEHRGKFAFKSWHGRYLGLHNHIVRAHHEFGSHELFVEYAV